MFIVNNQKSCENNVQTRIVFHHNYAIPVRDEMLEGRKQLVVPVVMMKEGVFSGSGGPMLYLNEEFTPNPQIWNGVPVPIFHPEKNGGYVSANSPEMIEKHNAGRLFNSRIDDGKLKAEAWLDVEKTEQVFPGFLSMVRAGKKIEISTGLFSHDDMTPGSWNGKMYNGVVRNMKPDHLALLPGQSGAFGWQDGMGIRYNTKTDEKEGGETMEKDVIPVLTKLKDILNNFLPKNKEDDKGKEKKDPSDKKHDVNINKSEADEKEKIKNNKEEKEMKEKVNQLIANGVFKEDQRETLMAMDEAILDSMITANEKSASTEKELNVFKVNEKKVADKKIADDLIKANAEKKEKEDTDKTPATAEEFIANAPPEIGNMMKEGMAMRNARKSDLITNLTANKECPFTEEQLKIKDIPELESMVVLAGLNVQTDYSGKGGNINFQTKKGERQKDGSGVPAPINLVANIQENHKKK